MPDRVVFAGSPWPEGHAVETLRWSARLEPGPRLWFDLDVKTVPYDQHRPGDEPSRGGDDWTSPRVWANYSRCTIRSGEDSPGFLVADQDRPLRLAELSGREFLVDDDLDRPSAVDYVMEPDDEYDPEDIEDYLAFRIYLLGHDSTADHRIRFPRWHGGAEFSLDWQGRVALAYVGDYEYEHTFRLDVDRVVLREIAVSSEIEPGRSATLLSQVLAESGEYVLAETGGAPSFRYRGA